MLRSQRNPTKNNVLAWRMFMASSMNAAIHLGPDFLKNSEIHKIREHRECVQHHSEIQKRTFSRNSEYEELGLFITIMDKINTVQR